MPDMNKLKGKITERRLNYDDCAKAIGISKASFNAKINNKTLLGFGVGEISILSKFLELTDEEKLLIFFN